MRLLKAFYMAVICMLIIISVMAITFMGGVFLAEHPLAATILVVILVLCCTTHAFYLDFE